MKNVYTLHFTHQNNWKLSDEATNESDITVYVNCAVRKSAIDRNKRCLIAYHMRRLEMIKKMRFELGPVIPAHIRNGKTFIQTLVLTVSRSIDT